jgi:O-antigen/teichoic acid export membrane protein
LVYNNDIQQSAQPILSRLIEQIRSNWALVFNSSSLIGTTGVTSALGVLYWWVAARSFSQEAVGLGSAAVSAMMLLGAIGMMGLGTLLIGELPRRREEAGSLISTSLIISAFAGGGLGVLFALLAPLLSSDLKPLSEGIGSVAVFGLGVLLTATSLVLDQALIGLMRGGLQFRRNVIFAASKLALLWVVGLMAAEEGTGLAIYAVWAAGNILSSVLLIWTALRHRASVGSIRPRLTLVRTLGRFAFQHHLLNLSLQTPSLTLPLIVTTVISAEANAGFYTAWLIATFAFYVPFALSTALFADSAAKPAELARKARLTLTLSFVSGIMATVVFLVGADFILGIFGEEYAAQAAPALRILALGVFPLTIKNHYIANCQVKRQVSSAAKYMWAGTFLEISLAAAGASLGGLAGLSFAWVVAVSIEALLTLPTVYRLVARSQPAPEVAL